MPEYVFIQIRRDIKDRLEEIRKKLNEDRVRPLDIDEVIALFIEIDNFRTLEKEIDRRKTK